MDEAALEDLAMAWLGELGYETAHGPDIIDERGSLQEVILWGRFEEALERINSQASNVALSQAVRQFRRRLSEEGSIVRCNREFQRMLIEGIPIEQREGGSSRTVIVRLVDRDNVEVNDWLAVNQVEVWHDRNHRIPDIVVYLNGLPISVFELKTFANEEVYLVNGFKQLQTYKKEIPQLFLTNEVLVASNGEFARFGSLTAGWDRYMPWRVLEGPDDAPERYTMELKTMLYELFERAHLLEYIHDYVLFLDQRAAPVKIIAGYHQSHAARHAFERTLEEVSREGRGRIGVVWHTQGSGKSLTMAFLTGLITRETEYLRNPTVIVITDRKDLDGQLFGTFGSAQEFLRQEPVRIEDKDDLVATLSGRQYGGIIFSTIQKFLPKVKGEPMGVLSERDNIIVIADEAHRSQYDFLDGFAAHLNDAFPNASFIGFTGTPIAFEDRNTRDVFGGDISVYDLKQSILDRSTVNIFLEQKRVPLVTTEESRLIDEAFETATEGEEEAITERAKRRWTRLEAAFGAEKRLEAIVEHMIPHIEERRESMPNGKVMVVCATRRICVRLHDMIQERRSEWYAERDDEGEMKVIMTGSAADSAEWGEHIRNSTRRSQLAERFRDPESDFRVAIVCDMWLTGFDAPSLSTMYIDKPMKGHGLMQALARVNRAFKDKSGGYVVDYFGLRARIAEAVEQYTARKGRGQVVVDADVAEKLLEEAHEVVYSMFHGIDFAGYWQAEPLEMERLRIAMLERINILVERDLQASQRRFGQGMAQLNKAYNLAKTSDYARTVRGDIKLFQSLHGYINHRKPEDLKDPELLDSAIQQILDESVAPTGLSDIIGISEARSIFDSDFVAHIQGIEQKNLAQAALEQLLRGEIKVLKKRDMVQSRHFSEMLEATLKRYRDGDNEDVQRVIDELLSLGVEIREAEQRGEDLGLSHQEHAFFNALETDAKSVRELGEDVLCQIAKALTQVIKDNITIDWSVSERKQAELRLLLRDILDEFGYPRSEQESAVRTVLEQAKLNAINQP